MLTALSPHALLIGFLLVMAVLSAFFLRLACGLCQMDLPSWRRSLISVVVVTFLSYLVFDFAAYLVMRTQDGIALRVPPGYGYSLWFREPIGLKLAIVNSSSFLRYIPFIFGLCAAGVLQVVVLQAQVTFRFGLFIFLLQWGATVLAGYILVLVLGVSLNNLGWKPGTAPPQQAQAPERPKQVAGRGKKAGRRPRGKAAQPPPTAEPKTEAAPTALETWDHETQAAIASTREYATHAWENIHEYADSYLDEVKEAAEPVTKHLPEPVQKALDEWGWWAIFGVLALIILLWLRSLLKRLAGAVTRPRRRKKVKRKKGAIDKENLRRIGESPTEEGPQQITVKGLPARLRLVVLSVGSQSAGELRPEMIDRVLDWIKPGLAEVTSGDYPRVKIWPVFYSLSGFATAFQNNVPIPEPKGERSRWVLVAGQVKMGKTILHVGLALHADEATAVRHLVVKGENWLDVLGVKDVGELAGTR